MTNMMKEHTYPSLKNSGFALITVLWITAFLAVIAASVSSAAPASELIILVFDGGA